MAVAGDWFMLAFGFHVVLWLFYVFGGSCGSGRGRDSDDTYHNDLTRFMMTTNVTEHCRSPSTWPDVYFLMYAFVAGADIISEGGLLLYTCGQRNK